MLNRLLVICILLAFSCEATLDKITGTEKENNIEFDLYMNKEYSYEDEAYIIEYPIHLESSYISVEYITEPMTRVFWYSEDTYTFIYWGVETTYPIIANSTYSDGNGIGRQLIYLYQDHIGKTLSVTGCIGEYCNQVYFIIKGV